MGEKSYVIVAETRMLALEREINAMIERGYAPQGGVIVAHLPNHLPKLQYDVLWVQAMVKSSAELGELLVAEPCCEHSHIAVPTPEEIAGEVIRAVPMTKEEVTAEDLEDMEAILVGRGEPTRPFDEAWAEIEEELPSIVEEKPAADARDVPETDEEKTHGVYVLTSKSEGEPAADEVIDPTPEDQAW